MVGPPRRPLPKGVNAWRVFCACLGLVFGASGAAAEQYIDQSDIVVASADQPVRQPDIIVTAQPLPVQPERSLDSEDLVAFGVDTVAEVLAEIAAQDGDGDEAAYLVNGRRVSGLGSVSDLPVEAIVRVDILPRGVGVAVGAGPGQRVYNIALRRELDLGTVRAGTQVATQGGWSSSRGELNYTRIQGQRRVLATGKVRKDERLLESERGIIQPATSPPDAASFRSLVPAADRLDLSASVADELTSWLSGSLTSRLGLTGRSAFLGPFALPALAEQPLEQAGKTLVASTDLNLNGQVGSWSLGLFANYIYSRSRTSTDSVVVAGPRPLASVVRSTVQSLGAQLSAFGPLLQLPAGPATLILNAGVSRDTIKGERRFQAVETRTANTLTSSTLSAALEVPITSRGGDFLSGVGDLSASLELGRQRVSDFGSFSNYQVSLLWRPTPRLTLNASVSRSTSAPPVATLDEPVIETPGIRYFDPLRGETVDVTLVTGGTPSLLRETDETRRLGVNFTPVRSLALRLTSEYSEFRQLNATSEFPSPSSIIFQTFPERFLRDAGGRLLAVDARPVTFPRRSERQLRTGLLLDLPLGPGGGSVASIADEDEGAADRGADLRSRVRPRFQLSAAHTWLMASDLVAREGQAPIDLLSQEAVGFGGLGRPRHRFDASVGYAERGLGARLSLQTRGASFIAASGSTSNVLRFEPLTSFSLRAWVSGERIAPRSPLMRGVRINLAFVNITGVRERVQDRFGLTPLSYQPGYRDPVGRSVEFSIRKTF
jgi:iron complex outermembrane recepter protein